MLVTNSENTTDHSQNLFDQILKKPDQKKVLFSQKKTFQPKLLSTINFSQNQFIGLLTLALLLVGSVAGIYLGQSNQEIRQQAAYTTCISGNQLCVINGPGSHCSSSGGTCVLIPDTGDCTCQEVEPTTNPYQCPAGSICRTSICDYYNDHEAWNWVFCNAKGDAMCCVPIPQTTGTCNSSSPTASACYGVSVGNSCNQFNGTCQGTGLAPDGTTICACVAITTATPIPTNTPVPVPTNTSVPTTPGQPTNTPVNVPTNTSVPISTNTPSSPTATTSPIQTLTLIPTNTSVPTTPGQPTNTSVPLPTNTSNPNSTATPILPGLPKAGTLTPTITIFVFGVGIILLGVLGVILLL